MKETHKMAKTEKAVAKVGSSALALPDFVKAGDARGREARPDREDIRMPRLTLAQGLSPEIEEGNVKYIDGLKVGDAFNTLTSEIYGKGAVEVVVVRRDPVRYIEFYDRDSNEGTGVKDFNVPPGDPRVKFGPNGEKPAATKFMEFVALLGPGLEPVALSFKGSGLATAKDLNGLLEMRNAPSFATRYALTPAKQTNDKGTYYVFKIRLAGNVDEKTFKYAEAVYDSIKGQDIVTDRDEGEEAPADKDVPF